MECQKAKFLFTDKEGNKCPYLIADSSLAKRLSALTQIMDDLKHAKELAELIASSEEGEIQYALWLSAVVTYGKCFVSAKRRRVKLEEYHVSEACREALGFHKDLLSLRNEFFAHAGENDYEASNIAVVLSPKKDCPRIIDVNHVNIKKRSVTEEFINPFCMLCDRLYSVAEKLGGKVYEKVFEEYQNMDVEILYAQADNKT
jgi:hypothetical protein